MESAKKIEGDLLDRGGFMQALDQLISMEEPNKGSGPYT